MLPPNLTVLRSALDNLLTDTGIVERYTGRTEQDEETGAEVPVMDVVHTGNILVRPEDDSLRVADYAQGVQVPILKFDVTLPAEVNVKIGDKVTVTSSYGDTSLVNTQLTITDVPLDSFQVGRFAKAERLP